LFFDSNVQLLQLLGLVHDQQGISSAFLGKEYALDGDLELPEHDQVLGSREVEQHEGVS